MMRVDSLSVSLFKEFSAKEWDALLENFDSTVNYTAWFLNYIEVLNVKSSIKNLTFVILDADVVTAIVPLYVEKIAEHWQMSMGQELIYAPIFRKNTQNEGVLKYYKYIISKIEKIANQYQCALARFYYSPLLYTKNSYNYFIKFGYDKDIFYPNWYIFKAEFSYIIDLLIEKNELYRPVRKSSKTIINRTRRETKLFVLDEDNFDQELFDEYVQLYYKIKGRKRSLAAFSLDAIAIKKGFEVLLLCQYCEKLVGSVALHTYNKKARYNSSVQDYNIDKSIYPNHFLLWESIVYLKEKNFELFEIGERLEDSMELSNKERNLSHFKTGWGGVLVPCIKAQKKFKHV